jgi:amidase
VVIFLNPRALEEAAALDEHLRKTGKFVGPLHGIPVLLKDNVNTKDMPTTGGSPSLAGYTPATDAAITQKLRSAGAIILAKVNLHEFAIWGETVSSIGGQTLNPYDLTRTPGGSSGGTGAGLAANFAIAGIGTDTINSIRSPSSANSIVGIRPTLGLVSAEPVSSRIRSRRMRLARWLAPSRTRQRCSTRSSAMTLTIRPQHGV